MLIEAGRAGSLPGHEGRRLADLEETHRLIEEQRATELDYYTKLDAENAALKAQLADMQAVVDAAVRLKETEEKCLEMAELSGQWAKQDDAAEVYHEAAEAFDTAVKAYLKQREGR